MDENKYREEMSKVQMSEQKKAEIKRNIYFSSRKEKAAVHAPRKKMSRGKKAAIAVTLSVFVVVAIGVGLFSPKLFDFFHVDTPMSPEDYLYIADRVENAQYLPNTEILAGVSVENSELASTVYNTQSDEVNDGADPAYFRSEIVDASELNFTLESYNKLNDKLAFISSTNSRLDTDIIAVKEQIELALMVIPGYDQWFTFDHDLKYNYYPYTMLSEYAYRLSYDSETKRIRLQTFSNRIGCDIYLAETGTLYQEAPGEYYCYTREYLDVVYYYDANGNEVVDCTVIDYHRLYDTYYPVMYQRIINIKDTSLTKFAVQFMSSYDLLEGAEDYDIRRNLSDAYDTAAIYPRGTDHVLIQLNYDTDSNITLLEAEHSVGDLHSGKPDNGRIAYYQKRGEDMSYVNMAWDNTNDPETYTAFLYNSLPDEEIQRDDIMDTFIDVMPLRVAYCCEDCIHRLSSADGVFLDCKHDELFDDIYRSYSIAVSDDIGNPMYTDIDTAYDAIIDTFNVFSEEFGTPLSCTMRQYEKFGFENSINSYIYKLSELIYEDISDLPYSDYEHDIDVNCIACVELDDATEVLSNRYIVIDNVNDNSTHGDDIVDYSVSGSFGGATFDPQMRYYISVIASNDADDSEYCVLKSESLSVGTNTFAISGSLTTTDILSDVVRKFGKQLQIDDVFRLAVVITVKNKDGEYVACTNLHDIHLSDAIGDNIEIGDVRSVEAGGKYYFCTLNVAVDGRVAIVITDV